MPSKGRDFEHSVANSVSELLDSGFSWTCGYSGNGAQPSPDIISVSKSVVRADELKKTRQDTFGIDVSDLRQLSKIARNFLDVGLVVKFSNRAPAVVEPLFNLKPGFVLGAEDMADDDLAYMYEEAFPDAFDARCTRGGEELTLRVSRPSLDKWPSAQAGDSAAEKIVSLISIGA